MSRAFAPFFDALGSPLCAAAKLGAGAPAGSISPPSSAETSCPIWREPPVRGPSCDTCVNWIWLGQVLPPSIMTVLIGGLLRVGGLLFLNSAVLERPAGLAPHCVAPESTSVGPEKVGGGVVGSGAFAGSSTGGAGAAGGWVGIFLRGGAQTRRPCQSHDSSA